MAGQCALPQTRRATREEFGIENTERNGDTSPEAARYYDIVASLSPAEKGLLKVYKSAALAGGETHELVGYDESSPRGLVDGTYDLVYLALNYPEDLARRCADHAKGTLRPCGDFVLLQDALEHETKRLRGSRNVRTRDSLLTHYVGTGRLLRGRRGLYAVVPPGQTPETVQPDPFLLAARMPPDAVLAYHTALEFHGRAYSSFHEFTYLTNTATRPAEFRGNTSRGAAFPRSLTGKNQESFGVETGERSGLEVRVTSLERTLVDVLDRPAISGGWEEIWRSLESVEHYDLDRISDYALMLDNSTTVAKVGLYLAAAG